VAFIADWQDGKKGDKKGGSQIKYGSAQRFLLAPTASKCGQERHGPARKANRDTENLGRWVLQPKHSGVKKGEKMGT